MLALPQAELEAFLTEIYKAIGGAAILKDKVRFLQLAYMSDATGLALSAVHVVLSPRHVRE